MCVTRNTHNYIYVFLHSSSSYVLFLPFYARAFPTSFSLPLLLSPVLYIAAVFLHTVQLPAVDIFNTFHLLQGKFNKVFKFHIADILWQM